MNMWLKEQINLEIESHDQVTSNSVPIKMHGRCAQKRELSLQKFIFSSVLGSMSKVIGYKRDYS